MLPGWRRRLYRYALSCWADALDDVRADRLRSPALLYEGPRWWQEVRDIVHDAAHDLSPHQDLRTTELPANVWAVVLAARQRP